MDYGRVFRRSWHMVTRYRALWIFGIVLGMVTFSWSTVLLGNLDDNNQSQQGIVITRLDGETFYDALQRTWQREIDTAEREFSAAIREFDRLLTDELGPRAKGAGVWGAWLDRFRDVGIKALGEQVVVDVVTILALLAGAAVITWIVARVARYVSQASLIRMVGEYEDTGQRRGVWQGLRMGFSRTGWRFFLIDLVVDVPVALGFLLLFALAFTPLFFGIRSNVPAPIVAGSLLAGGLFLTGIGLAVVVGTLLRVLKRFFRQACGLENLGVFASIRRGWTVARHNAGEVLVMWLIMLGTSLGWALVIAISFVVLFPLLILFMVLGGVAGSLSAYLAFLLSALLFEGALPVVLAVMVGLPIFIMVMFAPWTFLGGLMEVFQSSAWTLTYRELRTAEDALAEQVRAAESAGLEPAPAA